MALTTKQKIGAGVGITGLIIGAIAAVRAKVVPPKPKIKLSNLTISPSEVNPEQDVTISVTATNIAAVILTKTIHLAGDFMDQRMVALLPSESERVAFTVTPPVAGTYHLSVDGLTGSFVCTEAPVADIRLSNLVITPETCYIGEEVTISATATNFGTVVGSRTINCEVE